MMKYKEELIKSMKWLGEKDNTLFLGQATAFSGHAISGTLTEVPKDKLIELPVMEEVQMGLCTGLSLEGYVPISIYPRFNFMMLAINQLVNHIDKMKWLLFWFVLNKKYLYAIYIFFILYETSIYF